MKINEAVECMSKIYLHRIIDSYTKDTIKPDENISRKRITSDQDLLSDPDNIHKRLHFEGISFDSKILSNFLLEALLESDGSFLSERELIDLVIGFEKRIVEEAKNPEIFKFKDQEAIKTYKTILEVALEDNEISEDERRLLAKLRNHLGISLRDHFLIQSILNKFPKPDNEIHSEKEVKSELAELQKRGVVFYCNQCEGGSVYVVPEEIIPGVKKMMGVELSNKAFALLLNNLTVGALKQILEATELPISGKKDERIERITRAEIKPSQVLAALSNDELYQLCKSLPGVQVSGTKPKRISNIISHFDKLRIAEAPEDGDQREHLYEYYVELATRDRENLLSNNVISKDKDMDSAFEEATRYLFEKKFSLELEKMDGTEHADGLLRFKKSKELFMWDTKSKESIYEFPNDHFNQFRRYIHNSTDRVSCFLVIAPEISEKAEENAYRLKTESGVDTDVALISAEDLKWVADNWKSNSNKNEFSLDVLNYTGLLERSLLKRRMKIFL